MDRNHIVSLAQLTRASYDSTLRCEPATALTSYATAPLVYSAIRRLPGEFANRGSLGSRICYLSHASETDETCWDPLNVEKWCRRPAEVRGTLTLFVKCVPLLIRWVSIIRETCLYGMGFTRRTISNLRNFLVVPWRKLRKNESIKARDAFAFAMISVVNRLPLHSMSTHAQSRFSLTTFPPQDTAFDVEEPYFRREPSVV